MPNPGASGGEGNPQGVEQTGGEVGRRLRDPEDQVASATLKMIQLGRLTQRLQGLMDRQTAIVYSLILRYPFKKKNCEKRVGFKLKCG